MTLYGSSRVEIFLSPASVCCESLSGCIEVLGLFRIETNKQTIGEKQSIMNNLLPLFE